MKMQHRYVPHWFLGIVRFVRPCVCSVRCGMPRQVEYLNNPLPNRLAPEYFFHWNTFNVRSLSAMQPPNHVTQFLNITHATASTRSLTVQKSRSTPAAIAGVQRSVL